MTLGTPSGDRHRQHNGLILTVLCSAQLVLAVDVTVVNVAGATIQHALHFSAANLEWIVTAYALTFGGFLLLGGRIADLHGRRRLFLLGISGFGLFSLCAGISQTISELISARACQGICAAIIAPTTLALLAGVFPQGPARQRAFGLWATAGSAGGLIGFFLGGVITSTLGWRWIFFINIPIALLAITGALSLLPRDRDEVALRRRLDVPGAVLVTISLASLIFGLGEAETVGWSATPTLVALSLAPVTLFAFVSVERRTAEPLLPFALLRRRAAVGNAISVLQSGVGLSTAFLSPLFMQQIWGFSAGRAGLATLPLPIGYGIGARISSVMYRRLGPKRLATTGFVLITIGIAWLTQVTTHMAYFTTFMPALFIRAFGQGLVIVPVLIVVTSGVRREDQGVVSGLFNMFQQLGGSVGLATVATIAAAAAGGRSITHEAHGIRIAFIVCLVGALIGIALAVFALPKSEADQVDSGNSGLLQTDEPESSATAEL